MMEIRLQMIDVIIYVELKYAETVLLKIMHDILKSVTNERSTDLLDDTVKQIVH